MKANCPHKVKIRAGGVIFLLAARYVPWPYELKMYGLSNIMIMKKFVFYTHTSKAKHCRGIHFSKRKTLSTQQKIASSQLDLV